MEVNHTIIMKRIFCALAAIFVSLTFLLPSAAVMADDDTSPSTSPIVNPSLGIRAPQTIEVNQSFTLQVVEKHSRKPEAGVAVYQVKADAMHKLTASDNTTSFKTIMGNYATAAANNGILIGTTDIDGILSHTFAEPANYILVAIKDGFVPGFTRVHVSENMQKKLNVMAPASAAVGQEITITVTERGIARSAIGLGKTTIPIQSAKEQGQSKAPGQIKLRETTKSAVKPVPVPGADVYAIKMDAIIDYDTMLIKPDAKGNAMDERYTALAKEKGLPIGETNENGELAYTFTEKGRYILMACMDGFVPDFTRITIMPAERKALRLDIPESASPGQPVTLMVTERIRFAPAPHPDTIEEPSGSTGASENISQTVQPVSGKMDLRARPVSEASIYAVRLTDNETIIEPFVNNDDTLGASAEKYLSQAKQWLIGTTDENGQAVIKFAEAGRYILVAVKDSYLPAFDRIRIYQKPSVSNPRPRTSIAH